MKTLKTLFATTCLVASSISLSAQTASWSYGNNVATLNPATANLGIGTTTPKAKVDIAVDNANAIRIGKIGYAGNLSVPVGALTAQFNIDFTGYRDNQQNQVGARISALRFNAYNANSALIQRTGLAFYTNQSGTNSGTTDLLERMRIDPYGNVGIGTSNPQTKLEVAGTAKVNALQTSTIVAAPDDAFTYDGKSLEHYSIGWYRDSWSTGYGSTLWFSAYGGMKFFTTGTPRLSIHHNGHVGIGTTTPAAKLEVKAEGNPTYLENNANGFAIRGNDHVLYMGVNSTNHVSYIQSADEGTDVSPLLLNARGGNVGIGRMDAFYKLDVNGTIRAREVVVNLNAGADFVFEEDYALRPLNEVSDFITANKHLPEIPSAANMVEKGLDMGEFQIKLLQKIEELTLYIIEQDKRIIEQDKRIMELEKK